MIGLIRKSHKIAGGTCWGLLGLLLSCLVAPPASAVDQLDIEFGAGNDLLPYELVQLQLTDFGAKKLPVSNPVQVYRTQRTETDTSFVIHAFNSDIFSNDPAVFSLNNTTYPEIIDHDPVYINLTCFQLYDDDSAGAKVIIGGGYRNDSAYVLKSFPASNEFEFLYLASGKDLTGDNQWRGTVNFSRPIDYDFDGRQEMFCYIDPGRDLQPRLLCCVDPTTMTLEWTLPVASAVSLSELYSCGDSANPEIIFTTYNYKNGVEDENFSDYYCYLTRVDQHGQILDNRIISVEHGSKGLWPGASEGTFYLFHAQPLVYPDSVTDDPVPHYQLSEIDRDFHIIRSLDLDERVRQAWMDDYKGDGRPDLYLLYHGGRVQIYDTTLELEAASGVTGLWGFVDSLRLGGDLQKALVFSTAYGTGLYSPEFEWLGQLEAPVWICQALKYGRRGQVEQFLTTHENAYRIIQVSPRSIWTLVRNAFYFYQVYILAVLLLLLLLVVWINVRRLRTHKQLLAAREQLRSVFDRIHDVVYRADADGNLLWVTPSAARLLGYDNTDAMIGKHLSTLYAHPEDRAALLDRLEEDGIISDYEVELRRRDGSVVTVSASSSLWYDDSGKVIGVHGVVRDINRRKKAEQALTVSEEKYHNLFDRAQIGMFRSTIDGKKILAVNRQMAELYGGTVEELVASSPLSLWIDPAKRQTFEDRLLRDGEVNDLEIATVDKKGNKQVVRMSARYYAEEECIEGTVVDITERKKMLEALKESEERYATLTESSPDGIMAAGPNSLCIVFVNEAMCKLTGYSREELLAKRVGDLSEASERVTIRKDFEHVANGRTNEVTNVQLIRKDGTVVTVDIKGAQAQLGGKTVILGFFRDVTDLRQKELMLRQRTASLKRLSNRLIDLQENDRKFIARELHDTVAQNLALSKIQLETAARAAIDGGGEAIKRASVQVTEAIHQLKNISAELRPQMLDELGLAPTIEWYLNNYAREFEIDFETKGQPFQLESKKQINIFRIFQELMLNMKKHSGADRISVLLEYGALHVTLTVEDNGRGFDVTEVTNNWSSSSTFGLMNITERVEIVGGEFTINTKEGRGATFVITIPGK